MATYVNVRGVGIGLSLNARTHDVQRRPMLYLGLSGVALVGALLVPTPKFIPLLLGSASGLLALAVMMIAQDIWQ